MIVSQLIKPCRVAGVPQTRLPTTKSASQVGFYTTRTVLLTPIRASKDFDQVLMDVANKFESAENKGPIIGWTLAAFAAITTIETVIHWPLFDFLLGFPIQFLGILTAIRYGLKIYRGDDVDVLREAEQLVGEVSKELPGLGK